MIEDPQLRQLFKTESEEHLACLDDGLLRLEKTPTDKPVLEAVFRASHSLKGTARMLGLAKIESAAHGLESILNAAYKGETPLTKEVIERMTVVLVELRKLAQEAIGGEPAGTPAAGLPHEPKAPAAAPHPAPHAPQPAAPAPAVAQPVAAEPPHPAPAPTAVEPFRIDTVRVETRKLDDLLTQAGELSVIQGQVQHRLALMEELLEQWAVLERERRKRKAEAHAGEDAAAMARFGGRLKAVRDAFFEDVARLESTANLLEELVRATRLLPLSTVFGLFPRMVRDLAREQGKEVELAVEGGDIPADKRILEEMKDPLMHLIRNAIDHGIEPPAERERQGKPRGGTVRLRAAREDGSMRLEVSDDGRGLDLEAIRRSAAKRGIHDEETLAAMTPAQLQQLIFMPGFSTSTFVTELSGRGVGLDVVRVNVEHLKGSVRLESAAGRGLTVQVRLPLSLTITRLLLASAGGRLCGLPVEFVHTSMRAGEEDLFPLEGRPAVMLDGQPVIAPRLADLLELRGETPAAAQPEPTVCIVVQVGDERLGLRVDELLSEEEVAPKPLGAPLRRVRNVAGLAMLGSGEICAVLNPADLLRSAHKSAAAPAAAKAERPGAAARAAILLVEDSALVLAMEKRILEDAGYEVVTAVDGVDALNKLGSRPFAAVVSDIIMPNMDGLTLTARIRQEPRTRELPVVLVTTLGSDEDKRRGLEAGANAYLPKPTFDQRVLLETLKRLIAT